MADGIYHRQPLYDLGTKIASAHCLLSQTNRVVLASEQKCQDLGEKILEAGLSRAMHSLLQNRLKGAVSYHKRSLAVREVALLSIQRFEVLANFDRATRNWTKRINDMDSLRGATTRLKAITYLKFGDDARAFLENQPETGQLRDILCRKYREMRFYRKRVNRLCADFMKLDQMLQRAFAEAKLQGYKSAP